MSGTAFLNGIVVRCRPTARQHQVRTQTDSHTTVKRHAQRRTQEVSQQQLRAAARHHVTSRGASPDGRSSQRQSPGERCGDSACTHPRTHNRTNSANGSARSCHPPLAPFAALRSPPRAGRVPCPSGGRGWLAGNRRTEDLALTCCAELDCRLLDVEVAQRAVRAHPLHIRLNLPGRIKERGRGEIRGAPALLCCCGRRRQARHGRPRLRKPPAEEPPHKHCGAGGGCNS